MGHTFISGREVKLSEVLPLVIVCVVVSLWMLVSVALSSIESERLKEVIGHTADGDRILNSLTESVLGVSWKARYLGASLAHQNKEADVIGLPKKDEVAADEDIIKAIWVT